MNWDWDTENGECPICLGPGHYNEARHGVMDVARDEPCLTRVTAGPHLDTTCLSRWSKQDGRNCYMLHTVFTSLFTRNWTPNMLDEHLMISTRGQTKPSGGWQCHLLVHNITGARVTEWWQHQWTGAALREQRHWEWPLYMMARGE